ncbi:MAG: outer membrane protein transport protein [candidate division Zixibacteria bacterium]|nr:outer membrane protein transport protein [candidate division Zixibacteria bacterium]
MGILRYFAFLTLLLVFLLPSAFGSGFTFDGNGVKARGMGGAFRAVADDWSAACYNPAGYARMKDNQLAGNLTIFHNRYWVKPNILWGGQYESGYMNGLDIPNKHEYLNIPQGAFLARFPFWGEIVMGLSGYQAFDQNQTWQLYKNIPAYSRASIPGTQYYINLDVVAFQLTAAKNFMNDRLSVGIGLAVLRGDLSYGDLVLRRNPMPAPISDRPYERVPEWYKNDGNGWGIGYRAGLLYKATEKLDLGLVFIGKSSIDIDGTSEFKFYMGDNAYLRDNFFPTTEEYLFAGGEVVDLNSKFKTTLDLPASIGGGIAYKVNQKLTVALDAEMVFWSSFKGFDFTFSNFSGLKNPLFLRANDSLFKTNMVVPVKWDDAGKVMLGANYKAYSFIDVRAGGSFENSPVNQTTFIPQFFNLGDKYTVGFGLGFAIGYWNLDFATNYSHQKDLKITGYSDVNDDGLMDNLQGDYRANNYETVLGISYRF